MKILLMTIYPNIVPTEEMGLAYICSVLREAGHEVMFKGYQCNDIDYADILEFEPQIIGITLYGDSIEHIREASVMLKNFIPGVKICIGGCYATFTHKELMQSDRYIDYIIAGEGELAMLDLVNCLQRKGNLSEVKSLVYRNGAEIVCNELQDQIKDLDSLPYASRDILIQHKLETVIMSTSRGCMKACTFCSSKPFWNKWRGQSPKRVVDEIEHIYNTLGLTNFSFIDNSLEDLTTDRIKEIMRGIIKRGLKIKIAGNFRGDFYKSADSELMELLRNAGMSVALVGVEAGNQKDNKVYGKAATVEENEKTLQLLEDNNISVSMNWINFNAYSTLEGLKENADFLLKTNYCTLSRLISRYSLTPGTALFKRMAKDGLIEDMSGINQFNYKFVDQRIQNLYNYIMRYHDYLNENGLMSILGHFFTNSIYDRNLELRKDFTEINELNYEWFIKLLELTEKGWDKEEAELLSRAYLDRDYMEFLINNLGYKHLVYETAEN